MRRKKERKEEETVDASTDASAEEFEGTQTEADDTPPNELESLTRERDQLHNQLQRTLADLQNFRKRRVQEMSDARQSAIEGLIAELLPVLDNFHLAMNYGDSQAATGGETAIQSMQEGMRMVRSLLESVFERHGVAEIKADGQTFDPQVHEAVGIDPDPAAPEGVITKVMQNGYTFHDKVLRPTKVMVGGASEPSSAAEEATEDHGDEEPES